MGFSRFYLSCASLLFVLLFFLFVPLQGESRVAQGSGPVIVAIRKGSSSWETVTTLRHRGIIHHRLIYQAYLKWTHNDRKLQAGMFLVQPGLSFAQLTRVLTGQDPSANRFKITIPEGFSITEIGDRLEAHGLCRSRDFVVYAKTRAKNDLKSQFPFLEELPIESVEGYLFPDTYFFIPTGFEKDIFIPFFQAFEANIYPQWKSQASGRLTFHQTMTLASIIEKEARLKSEQALISGVFYNRLNRNQLLESCPTVVYALGLRHLPTVTYKDLLVRSPYNTYRHPGLPPGPICNPGIDAFHAALHPASTPYYYFFASGKGAHVFSRTYKEHLLNQRKK